MMKNVELKPGKLIFAGAKLCLSGAFLALGWKILNSSAKDVRDFIKINEKEGD